ncbi:MAG: efflux RND transporter periplasmic adaptor subunit [Alphaproteobacteria bacterium]
MRRALRTLVILIVIGAVGGGIWYALTGNAQQQAPRGRFGPPSGPVPVLAVEATTADVPITIDAVGTVQALNTVTVRPQVDGQIIAVLFKEGEDVRRGDVLAQIDPTTFKAQLDQAMAKKAQDEANLANARVDLQRYTRLARTDYATQQQADTQRAAVAQLEALVRADQAAIDTAKTTLERATITAPIDGRTGLRLVDEGNLVSAGSTTGIVVITQVQPIATTFNLPQQNLRAVNAALGRGAVPVQALGADNTTVLDSGQLDVVDNQVDQTTGTVKMKASFPNARRQLWPGQFVNIRLQVGVRRNAVVVPTAAIQRGPTGTVVYGLDAEDKVTLKPVTVAQQDENRAVVASGIAAGERVVTSGFARLTNGTQVRVTAPADPAAAPAAAPRPQGQGQGRRGPGGGQRGEGGGRPRGEGAPPPAAQPAAPAPAATPPVPRQ